MSRTSFPFFETIAGFGTRLQSRQNQTGMIEETPGAGFELLSDTIQDLTLLLLSL